jgi:hypothetical protein
MGGEPTQLVMMWLGILGAFVSIFSVWYKIDRDTNAKIDSISKSFADQLAKAIEVGDEKRARIYTRIDEVKTAHKDEIKELQERVAAGYVPVRICTLMHTNSKEAMAELKIAIGELKDAIAEVNGKVDKVSAKLYEKNEG